MFKKIKVCFFIFNLKLLLYELLEGFELGEGAWYFLNEYQGVSYSMEMWLCDVTKYVFGDFPNRIYFK